jgi:hemolysin activation/secretion protein
MVSRERRARSAGKGRSAAIAAAIAATIAGVGAATAQAQAVTPTTPDPVTQEGLRRQEERSRKLRAQQAPGADVLRPPEAKPAQEPLTAETPCFVIREIQPEGPGWEHFAWVADAAKPYLGQCAGVRGLSRIASALDAALLERGFATTRVSLPQQNLQTGSLHVQLHVGLIAGVRMVEAGKSRSSGKTLASGAADTDRRATTREFKARVACRRVGRCRIRWTGNSS